MIIHKIPEPCINPLGVYIFPLDNGMWAATFLVIDGYIDKRVSYRFSAELKLEKIGDGSIHYEEDKTLILFCIKTPIAKLCDVITPEGMISPDRNKAFKFQENTTYQCAPINYDYFPDTTARQCLVKKIISKRFGIHVDDGTIGIMSGERATILKISDQEIVDPVVSLDGSMIAMCVPKRRQIILIDNPLIGD